MPNFLQLQQFRPGDSRIDTAPVQNALEAYGNKTMQFNQIERQNEAQQYQRGRDTRQDARQDETFKQQNLERLGKSAFAFSQLPPEQRDPQTWGRMVKGMQSYDPSIGTDPDDLDPIAGPAKFAAVYGGQVRDPREDKLMDLKLQGAQLDIAKARQGPKPEYREVNGKIVELGPNGPREVYSSPDPVTEMLMQRLNPQRQGAPAQGGVAPMSAPGGGNMGAQFIQANEPDAAQPQMSAESPNMIDTPFGKMTREDAQQLGGAMLLDPRRHAAGKAILDSLQGGGSQLSKPAETQLDERTISAASTLGRLQEIRKRNNPRFQQIPDKLKMTGLSWGAAMGAPISPEMRKDLSEFAKYRVAAFDNFNQLLKELSGTAVSAQELARQKIVQPNPGEGIFDGDDPVTFEAKMDQGEKISRSAIARMNFMRSRGIQFNKDTAEQFLRLEDVPRAMDERGAQIEQELKRANPTADPTSIEREALNRVRKEFGI
jgi:hypothetical protein